MNKSYIFLLLMPVLVTAGQVLLKKSVPAIVTGKGLVAFLLSCRHPGIIAAAVCVAASPFLYISALGSVPLSEAFAFNSLNYILVFLTGRFLLKEKVDVFQAVGVVLIASGFLFPFIVELAGA